MTRAIGLVLLGLLQAQTPQPSSRPTFESAIESVFVDVYVADKSGAVANLTAKDFGLLDNGVAQTVELVDQKDMGSTVVLVLDASSSVAGERLQELKLAARRLLSNLRPGDDAALVAFSQDVRLMQPPSPPNVVSQSLDRIQASGATSLYDAVYLALRRSWGEKRTTLVVFTDGADTTSFLDPEEITAAARASAATVYVVGIVAPAERHAVAGGFLKTLPRTDASHLALLSRVTDLTGGATWGVESNGDLRDPFAAIGKQVVARYVLRFEPRGVQREGLHRLKVHVKRSGVDARFRQEYVVGR